MKNSKRMFEPGVLGAGIHKIGHAELFDPPEALEQWIIDDPQELVIKTDMIMYRATDPFHGPTVGVYTRWF